MVKPARNNDADIFEQAYNQCSILQSQSNYMYRKIELNCSIYLKFQCFVNVVVVVVAVVDVIFPHSSHSFIILVWNKWFFKTKLNFIRKYLDGVYVQGFIVATGNWTLVTVLLAFHDSKPFWCTNNQYADNKINIRIVHTSWSYCCCCKNDRFIE